MNNQNQEILEVTEQGLIDFSIIEFFRYASCQNSKGETISIGIRNSTFVVKKGTQVFYANKEAKLALAMYNIYSQ